MSSSSKGANPLWGPSFSSFSTSSTTAPQQQQIQHRRQTWASVTWATGQSIISGMLSPSKDKKDFDVSRHHRNEYHAFRDEMLMGPPAYDSIVSPRTTMTTTRPESSRRRRPQQALPPPRTDSHPHSPPPQQPYAQPAKVAPALQIPAPASRPCPIPPQLPPLPRLLGLENLDEWDDMLHRTLRLHGLAAYLDPDHAPPPEQHDPAAAAAICLLIVGSLSSDVRDTLTAGGYEPAASAASEEDQPAALHALVLEALPKAAGEDVASWMRELSTISPGERRFDGSLRAFCLRVAYLRRRLEQAEPQPNDNLVLVMAVLGLARCERYEGVSFALGRELERGALSWARLMADLAGVHGREVRERRERWKSGRVVEGEGEE